VQCWPRGAECFQLVTHTRREMKGKYLRPYSGEWAHLDLEQAMDMVADRLWKSRATTFTETKDGRAVMQTKAIGHLGGATLDIEENYLIKKVLTAGLGMVCLSNAPLI